LHEELGSRPLAPAAEQAVQSDYKAQN
jgi:hypothetical protein